MNRTTSRTYNSVATRLTFLLVAMAATLIWTATEVMAESNIVKRGEFAGLSDHVTTGEVTVVRTQDGLMAVFAESFSLDGAPDPKVGLGRDGVYDVNAQLAPLAAKTGRQTYEIPASVDVENYDEIYIWCEKFRVPLGVAKLR